MNDSTAHDGIVDNDALLIHRAVGRNAKDNRPLAETLSWGDLCALLSELPPVAPKEGSYQCFARFREGLRRAANVEEVFVVGIDIDAGNLSEADIRARIGDYDFFAHTTHSSTPEARKWRVLLLLARPVTPAEYAVIRDHFFRVFGCADTAASDASRLWYLPRRALANSEFLAFRNEGLLCDPSAFDYDTPPHSGASSTPHDERSRFDPWERVEEGKRDNTLARFCGWYLNKTSCGEMELLMRASSWNRAMCVPPLEQWEVEKTVQSIHMKHYREKGQTEALHYADWSVARWLDKPPPTARWLVDSFIPLGKVGGLIAPGGTGKSFLMQQLATSVAAGTAWCDHWQIAEPGGVLCLPAEDDEDELHRRFARIVAAQPALDRAKLARNMYVRSVIAERNHMTIGRGNTVKTTDYVDRVLENIGHIPDLKLIVIDPASRFRGGEENSAEAATRFVEELERLSKETSATVLVAHHTNKAAGGGGASQNASRGSSALVDGMRFMLQLRRVDPDEVKENGLHGDFLKLAGVKSNYARQDGEHWLERLVGGCLKYKDVGLHRASKTDDLTQAIVKFVEDEQAAGRRLTKSDLTERYAVFGTKRAKLRELVDSLLASGVLGIAGKQIVRGSSPFVTSESYEDESDTF